MKHPRQDCQADLAQAIGVYRKITGRAKREPASVLRNMSDEEWDAFMRLAAKPVRSQSETTMLGTYLLASVAKEFHDKPFSLPTPEAMRGNGAPEAMARIVRRERNNALAAVNAAVQQIRG